MMSEPGLPRTLARRLIGLFIGVLVLVSGLALYSAFQGSRRAENERTAVKTLQCLISANAEFRSQDRDGNGVLDFWTGDVAGLRYLEAEGKPIGLIPAELADADGAPLKAREGGPKAYHGYIFVALKEFTCADGRRIVLQVDPNSGGEKVHAQSDLGYCAYPAQYGVTGEGSFVTVGGDVFKEDCKGKPLTEFLIPHTCDKYSNRPLCPMGDCPEARKSEERRREWRAKILRP